MHSKLKATLVFKHVYECICRVHVCLGKTTSLLCVSLSWGEKSARDCAALVSFSPTVCLSLWQLVKSGSRLRYNYCRLEESKTVVTSVSLPENTIHKPLSHLRCMLSLVNISLVVRSHVYQRAALSSHAGPESQITVWEKTGRSCHCWENKALKEKCDISCLGLFLTIEW